MKIGQKSYVSGAFSLCIFNMMTANESNTVLMRKQEARMNINHIMKKILLQNELSVRE
jgi:hypothetical protein